MKRKICLRYGLKQQYETMMAQIKELSDAGMCKLCEISPVDEQYRRVYIETELDDATINTLFDYCVDGGQTIQWS